MKEQLFNPLQPDHIKAISVAFGVFMGIVPIWGFQLVVAIFLSILLKLNKPLVIIAANISIPPMIPFIIFLSYVMGSFWVGDGASHFTIANNLTLDSMGKNLPQYIYGSITLAIVAGLTLGLLTLVLLKIFKKKHSTAV